MTSFAKQAKDKAQRAAPWIHKNIAPSVPDRKTEVPFEYLKKVHFIGSTFHQNKFPMKLADNVQYFFNLLSL